MTKEAYGIPVPRGVQKDWVASDTAFASGKFSFRRYSIPPGWGEPAQYVAWFDRFSRCRLIVIHYSNGRSATVRIDVNGISKTTFGDVG